MGNETRPTEGPVGAALNDLGRKLDTVAGAVAAIAGGHRDLLGHVAESEARRGQDSTAVARRLEALQRQVVGLGAPGGDRADAAGLSAITERLDRIERQLSALPGTSPGVESTLVGLTDRLDAVLEAEPERRAALHHLTEVTESAATRLQALTDDPPPLDPNLGEALATLQAQLSAVADAHGAMAAELAALGPRVNELLERHPDGLPTPPPTIPEVVVPDEVSPPPAEIDLTPLQGQVADLMTTTAHQREDLALSLEVLARVAEAVERVEARTRDRAPSGPDDAVLPLADLEAVLSARGERTEARFEEMAVAVRSITSQLPELGDDVTDRLTEHTDTALAAVLRLIDERLFSLRRAFAEGGDPGADGSARGFEAGAVMGAAQAAWNRLEQRLDTEFDDLGRQLQAIASLIDNVVTATEDLANRPIVSGEQFRKAATTLRETVASANRSRRERRGGPRSLGS